MVFQQTPVLCWPEVSAKGCLVTNVGGLGPPRDTFLQHFLFCQIASPRPEPRNWSKSEFVWISIATIVMTSSQELFQRYQDTSQKFAMTYQLGEILKMKHHCISNRHFAWVFHVYPWCFVSLKWNVSNFLPFQFPVPTKKQVHSIGCIHHKYYTIEMEVWRGFCLPPCMRKGTKYMHSNSNNFFRSDQFTVVLQFIGLSWYYQSYRDYILRSHDSITRILMTRRISMACCHKRRVCNNFQWQWPRLGAVYFHCLGANLAGMFFWLQTDSTNG